MTGVAKISPPVKLFDDKNLPEQDYKYWEQKKLKTCNIRLGELLPVRWFGKQVRYLLTQQREQLLCPN